ncbi:hypothetical protein [Rhizobium tumorigenes]|uniref:DinB/UmuC family translesion DNA polymerase n=1 Tax=Rhizobium tumorigenes TaxID=2041385 RepID=UPI003C7C63D5
MSPGLGGIHRNGYPYDRTARDGIQPPIDKVWGYLAANGIAAKTATLKAKYADFNQIGLSKTVSVPFREGPRAANGR